MGSRVQIPRNQFGLIWDKLNPLSWTLPWTIACNLVLQIMNSLSFELLFKKKLVWTPCLMHRCVCIWQYILQNYNYKLHFQNLSICHIPHVFIGTLAAENLDVCTACDSWDSNIQLTMDDAIHGWMMGQMDGWMGHVKNFTKNDQDVLYYM